MSKASNVIALPLSRHMDSTKSFPPAEEQHKPDHLATLIEAIAQRQDRAVFHTLLKDFGPKIKAYAIRQGMLEYAEELVQEVMVNIWRRAKQFDRTKASASTWLFAITRNARIDMLRKLNRSSQEVQVESEFLWSLPGEGEPSSAFQLEVHSKKLRESLNDLPTEQREVITKVYLEDKSHQRVAEELELPLGTVKSRVRLALQKLLVILQDF